MTHGALAGAFRRTCRCGSTKLKVHVPTPASGTRLQCFCGDCQTAACLHDPDQDTLTPAGGTNIWHTTPDRLEFETDADNLAISRLSPRGGYRWYAACCGTLMFSTAKNLKLPFVSIPLRVPEVAEADMLLGPVTCQVFTASARKHPEAPSQNTGVGVTALRAVRRGLMTWITGRTRLSPLRGKGDEPIAPVTIISLEARNAARPDHLPPC